MLMTTAAVIARAGLTDLAPGLREYPPNEVLMLLDRESDWGSATEMGKRVREEVGLPVTVIEPARRAAA